MYVFVRRVFLVGNSILFAEKVFCCWKLQLENECRQRDALIYEWLDGRRVDKINKFCNGYVSLSFKPFHFNAVYWMLMRDSYLLCILFL